MKISSLINETNVIKRNSKVDNKNRETRELKSEKDEFKSYEELAIKNNIKLTKTIDEDEAKRKVSDIKEKLNDKKNLRVLDGLSNIRNKIVDSLV